MAWAKQIPVAERDVQKAILELCARHPAIAWAQRINVGAMKKQHVDKKMRVREHFVRFAFKGCSDIIGQMADGRFFAWEVKKPGKKPSADQQAFIDRVNASGGFAGWSDDVTTLYHALESDTVDSKREMARGSGKPDRERDQEGGGGKSEGGRVSRT